MHVATSSLLFFSACLFASYNAQDVVPVTPATTTPPATADVMELLEFDPPLFTLQENRDTPTSLRVRLRQPPRHPTTLYFESPNLKFSECALKFHPRTFSDWHKIDVRGLPYFTDADRGRQEEIRMRMSCPRGVNGWHGRNWTLPVQRPNVKGATCTSNGDPHITTFDGLYYSYQGLGCFYLVKSDALVIQTMTDKWHDATVSVATAIRFGRAHFIVDSREADPGKRLVQLSESNEGVEVIVSANHAEFRFRTSDGSAVTITFHQASPRNYLDHQIDVPACARGKVRGLCGTFNGNQADDYTGPDGTLHSDYNKCGDSWKVPADDDMFICKDRCPAALAARTIQSCDQCKIPTDLSGHGKFRDPDTNYRPFTGSRGNYAGVKPHYDTTRPHLIPRPQVDAAFSKRAHDACTAAFNFPDFHRIVPTTPFIKACISDCEITRTLAMVDAKKSAYLNRVHSTVNPVLSAASYLPAGREPSALVKTCRRAADQLGLGRNRCPRDCSGHGMCRKCGCKCNPGWSGVACAVRLDAYGIPVVAGGRMAQQSVYGPPRRDTHTSRPIRGDGFMPTRPMRGQGNGDRLGFSRRPMPTPFNRESLDGGDAFDGDMMREQGGRGRPVAQRPGRGPGPDDAFADESMEQEEEE